MAWLLPSERNGRVSGVLAAWVGRLRARASNCRPPVFLSLSPSANAASRVLRISCVAYRRNGIRSYRCHFPPTPSRGCGVDDRRAACSSHASHRCGAVEARGAVARSLGCGTSCAGAGSRPRSPEPCVCPLTRTTAAAVLIPSRPACRTGLMRSSASSRNATWLILPVVICLSQRLSHACVSMN